MNTLSVKDRIHMTALVVVWVLGVVGTGIAVRTCGGAR